MTEDLTGVHLAEKSVRSGDAYPDSTGSCSPMTTDESAPATPSFEAALAELQLITQRLEAGEGGLEGSLADFEQGVKLLRDCYRRLDEAEQKIEQLVDFDAAGIPCYAPFDGTATAGQPAGKRRRKNEGE